MKAMFAAAALAGSLAWASPPATAKTITPPVAITRASAAQYKPNALF